MAATQINATDADQSPVALGAFEAGGKKYPGHVPVADDGTPIDFNTYLTALNAYAAAIAASVDGLEGQNVALIGAAATATTSSVSGSTSSITLLAANSARLGGSIVNDSTAILYILLGSGTASATNYSYVLDGKTTVGGTFEIPKRWTGAIKGIWASATGAARVTERTA